MKKLYAILLTAFLVVIATELKAQTQKDYYLIGADIANLDLDLQEDNTIFTFSVTPRVAWFIRDNVALGLQALLGLTTGDDFTNFNYGIGPVARYYFTGRALESLNKTRWFADADVGFYGNNTKAGNEKTSTNGLGFGIGPGLAYFVTSNIALEAMAKYNLTVGFGNSTTNNAISLRVGFQIHLPRARLKTIQRQDINTQ